MRELQVPCSTTAPLAAALSIAPTSSEFAAGLTWTVVFFSVSTPASVGCSITGVLPAFRVARFALGEAARFGIACAVCFALVLARWGRATAADFLPLPEAGLDPLLFASDFPDRADFS